MVLEQIKLLTGSTKDNLINLLIDKTKLELQSITNKEYDESWNNLIVDIVVCKLNRIGTEGTKSTSINGLSEDYLEDYPKPIIRQINKIKGMVQIL